VASSYLGVTCDVIVKFLENGYLYTVTEVLSYKALIQLWTVYTVSHL
jgi:hypothetical protein